MSRFEIEFDKGTLVYQLYATPLACTWSRMAEWYYGNDEFKREVLYQNFEPATYQDECDKLRDLGYGMLAQHSRFLDEEFQVIIGHRIYTRDDLNWLHEQYEAIRKQPVGFSLPEAFNDQIHVCERFHRRDGTIKSTIEERPRIRVRFIHKEWEASAPWKMRYRSEDVGSFREPISGRLYMCYCEVGKPPYSTYRDRDTTVPPVNWTTYGPAFYTPFQNWNAQEDQHEAREWLVEHHGQGVYWMGEPELGTLINMTAEDAYEIVNESPTIRGMRWN